MRLRALGTASGKLTARQQRSLVGLLLLAFALRLAWALFATRGEPSLPFSGDAFSYYYYGQEFAAGDGYVSYIDGEPDAYYPVGYPALLAGLFWLVLHTPLPDELPMAGSLLHVVLGTAAVGLVFVIARRLFDATTGLVAAGLLAVFPNVVFYTSTLQLETTFIFLLLAAVAVLVTHDWSTGPPSHRRVLLFGLALGLSALVRPFSLPLLVGLLVAFLLAGAGWRRGFLAVGLATLPVVAVLAPIVIRNAVVLDAPVLSTNMGDTLCLDRHLDATGEFAFAEHEYCAPGAWRPVERNPESTRLALEFIREHPGKEVELVFLRARHMMDEDHDGLESAESGSAGAFLGRRLRGTLTTTADWFFYVTLVPAVLGLIALARRRGPQRAALRFTLVAVLTGFLIPLALWGNPRFHVPLAPFLAIGAAVTLTWAGRRLLPPSVSRAGRRPAPAAP